MTEQTYERLNSPQICGRSIRWVRGTTWRGGVRDGLECWNWVRSGEAWRFCLCNSTEGQATVDVHTSLPCAVAPKACFCFFVVFQECWGRWDPFCGFRYRSKLALHKRQTWPNVLPDQQPPPLLTLLPVVTTDLTAPRWPDILNLAPMRGLVIGVPWSFRV